MWVAFTGAGISQSSGIPTFEERPDLRDVLDRDVWEKRPQKVWEAIFFMYEASERALPNEAHLALSESRMPIITQNIDSLHQRAGSPKVIELHGTLRRAACVSCRRVVSVKELKGPLPLCSCLHPLKPQVVLYQEPVDNWERAYALVEGASNILVVGTSLSVYPAAQLPQIARFFGAALHVINQESASFVPQFLKKQGLLGGL